MTSASSSDPAQTSSPWAPFSVPAYSVIWCASVVSSIGTWMHDVGAGWLMTQLSASPAVVASVQAATTLPIFLFALIAGATADLVSKRWLLITANVLMASVATGFTVIVWAGAMTAPILLALTFCLGMGAAFSAPAWQAIVPALVGRPMLPAALALNGMGINISRAIGPALAGFLIVSLGLTAPFALNALSFVGILGALFWWKMPAAEPSRAAREHMLGAVLAGLRYAKGSGPLKATLYRAALFFLCASAFWALLPLVAKTVLEGGPSLYGLLLASVGSGAVAGAFFLPRLRARLGANGSALLATIGLALALFTMSSMPAVWAAIGACFLAGLSWVTMLASLNVSAQMSLPDWVRARGLSIFLTVFFGAMSLGSLLWGQVATHMGILPALMVAAIAALFTIALGWPVRIGQGDDMDLSPALHWPEPIITAGASADLPIGVHVHYSVAEGNIGPFLDLMQTLRAARERLGAYRWTLMQDGQDPANFIEYWMEPSWPAHLRHHDRVTQDDAALQASIAALLTAGSVPIVRHLFSPMTDDSTPQPIGFSDQK